EIRVDQTLFVRPPARWMISIAGMSEHRDAEGFSAERALDGAPVGALLLAVASANSVGVEMGLARILLVPRHSHREPPTKYLPKPTSTPFARSNTSKSIAYVSSDSGA